MFGSQVLEVGIGLVFIFFIFSLVTSAITEALSNFLALRARHLERGLLKLLNQDQNTQGDNTLAAKFFEHGLIKNLGRRHWNNRRALPSYLPANHFANALLDSIVNLDVEGAQDRLKITGDELKNSIKKINDPALEQVLQSIITEVEDEIQAGVVNINERMLAVRRNVENWFNGMMERVSGWYKRSVQKIIFVAALIIAVTLNVDTIMMTNILWNAPTIRAAVASTASETVTVINSTPGEADSEAAIPPTDDQPPDTPSQDIKVTLSELQDLQIIGWTPAGGEDARAVPSRFDAWIFKVFGLAITAFALTLGSPFWFDILSKLVNLRGAGGKPEDQKADSGASPSAQATFTEREKAANREINQLEGRLEALQASLKNQFIDIVVDRISDDNRLLRLFNFNYRGLNPIELQECKAVLGDKVAYEEVKIFEGNELPNFLDDIGRLIKDMPQRQQSAKNAITLGNCCFFGRELSTKDVPDPAEKLDEGQVNDMSWLIHELTHVWQFQSEGWEYLWKAWDAQREMKADAYKYGGESGLRRKRFEGAKFHSFNPEQQGQITQDYYKRLKENAALKLSGKEGLDNSSYQYFIEAM